MRIVNRIGSLVLVLSIIGTTQFSNATGKRNLFEDLNSAQKDVNKLVTIAAESPHVDEGILLQVKTEIDRMYKFLYNINSSVYSIDDTKSQGLPIIQKSFELRRWLRKVVTVWNREEALKNLKNGPEVVASVRNLMRAGRYLEDVIAESMLMKQTTSSGSSAKHGADFIAVSNLLNSSPQSADLKSRLSLLTTRGFQGGRAFDFNSFQSGDILLFRGASSISAAIARITDSVTQFSHVAIVYVDPTTKQKFILESLIDKGVIIRPLVHALDHSLPRISIYRFDDAKIAHVAAEETYKYIKRLSKNGKVKIKYDFSMNLTDHSRIFCSELVAMAFDLAAKKLALGKDRLAPVPYFSNSFLSKENRNFLQRITISDDTTIAFAPGDIDVDPRFDLLAEYRDFSKTEQVRVHDLIFDKVFEWTEKDKRKLKESFWMNPIAYVAYQVSSFEPLKAVLSKAGLPIDPDIKPSLVRTILILEFTKRGFEKPIYEFVARFKDTYKFSPPPKLIYQQLEFLKNQNGGRYLKLFPIAKNSEIVKESGY
tara:strand:- start:17604 stop:19220 length:1617 start_codon:yes stop_codon:yes gene_type:complete